MTNDEKFLYRETVRQVGGPYIAFRDPNRYGDGIVTASVKDYVHISSIPWKDQKGFERDFMTDWNKAISRGTYSAGRTESSARKREVKFQAEFDKVEIP